LPDQIDGPAREQVDNSPPNPTVSSIVDRRGSFVAPREAAYVGRSTYISGETPIDETKTHAYASKDEAPLGDTQLKTLDLWGSNELPPRAIRKSLIDTYIQRCYPWTPIPNLDDLSSLDSSQLLLQALFLAASRVSSAPGIRAYASSEQFYSRAKALFWCGHEKNPLTVIVATIMLHWYNGEGPEHVSFDTSRFWSHISTGLAHQVGLHREPVGRTDAPFRRRLWWSLVVSSPSPCPARNAPFCLVSPSSHPCPPYLAMPLLTRPH